MDSFIIYFSVLFYIIVGCLFLIKKKVRVKYLYGICILFSFLLFFAKMNFYMAIEGDPAFPLPFITLGIYLIASIGFITIFLFIEICIFMNINIKRIFIQYFCFIGFALYIGLLLLNLCEGFHDKYYIHRAWYPLYSFIIEYAKSILKWSIIMTIIFFFVNLIAGILNKKMSWNKHT